MRSVKTRLRKIRMCDRDSAAGRAVNSSEISPSVVDGKGCQIVAQVRRGTSGSNDGRLHTQSKGKRREDSCSDGKFDEAEDDDCDALAGGVLATAGFGPRNIPHSIGQKRQRNHPQSQS